MAGAGEFDSHEVARYRQFVWIIDALHGASFVDSLRERLALFGRIAARVVRAPAAACVAAGIAALLTGVRPRELARTQGSVLAAAGVTLVLTLVFFGSMGWYNELLEWNMVPPVLAITAVLLAAANERASRPARVILAVAVAVTSIGWLGHEVCTKRGSATPAADGVRSPVCPSVPSLLDLPAR
jgi:hypothetical protein